MPFSAISFLFTRTATTEIYTLSLHDALPICVSESSSRTRAGLPACRMAQPEARLLPSPCAALRSEEHTSELQSHVNLVCRLLLEKKNRRLGHPAPASAYPGHAFRRDPQHHGH